MPAYLYQTDNYSCGAVALYNALLTLGGEWPDYETVRQQAGTTRRGTTGRGILKALEANHLKGLIYRTRLPDRAWRFALTYAPTILLVDPYLTKSGRYQQSHWITSVNILGASVLVVDPSSTTYKYTRNELLARWQSRSGLFLGIRLSSP